MQFFPSITSGYQKFNLINNDLLTDKRSCRYYNHLGGCRNVMISAGFNYRFPLFRKDIGAENAIVLSDSGGYQLITGAINYKEFIKKLPEIFTWLESNSDISLNLDVSPLIKGVSFKTALKLSYSNFKYFNEHQSGKTKFLNVLQGRTKSEILEWFTKVKDFEFNGWAVGNMNLKNLPIILDLLGNTYIHFLGIYDLTVIKILKEIESKYSLNFSYDTSLPSRLASSGIIFGENGNLTKNNKISYLDALIININYLHNIS